MKTEHWKPVLGYEGLYEISNLGRVKSIKRKGRLEEKILQNFTNKWGQAHVTLSKDSRGRTTNIERIMKETWNKPC